MIINLKRPLMTKHHLNQIIKFLKLLHHLIKRTSHLKAAIKVNRVAARAVIPPIAITATGVNGASAHKTAALVPKPALVKLWDHPMPIVLKLRSHSHATLMLAPTAAVKATTTAIHLS
jgi:hypothetical protein